MKLKQEFAVVPLGSEPEIWSEDPRSWEIADDQIGTPYNILGNISKKVKEEGVYLFTMPSNTASLYKAYRWTEAS